MKKIISILLITMFCFIVVGCGKLESDDEELDTKVDNSVETGDEELKLYSDNTKYVFEYTNTKYVFYYSGDKITAYHTYVDYQNAAQAKAVYSALKLEDYEELDKVSQKGRYLVFEWNESTYEDLSASELKTVYSYMKELKG